MDPPPLFRCVTAQIFLILKTTEEGRSIPQVPVVIFWSFAATLLFILFLFYLKQIKTSFFLIGPTTSVTPVLIVHVDPSTFSNSTAVKTNTQ